MKINIETRGENAIKSISKIIMNNKNFPITQVIKEPGILWPRPTPLGFVKRS